MSRLEQLNRRAICTQRHPPTRSHLQRFSNQRRKMKRKSHVRYWHLADILAGAANVRFRGQSGHHSGKVDISGLFITPVSPRAWVVYRAARRPRGGVTPPHCDGRRGEIRVGEVANGNGDVPRKAFALPVDGGAACRTEMKGQRVAAFGCPHRRGSLPPKVTCSRRKRAWLLITAPVRRWHSRQWHMEMRDGSPSILR